MKMTFDEISLPQKILQELALTVCLITVLSGLHQVVSPGFVHRVLSKRSSGNTNFFFEEYILSACTPCDDI